MMSYQGLDSLVNSHYQRSAQQFHGVMSAFEQTEGRTLDAYLRSIGREPAIIEGYGAAPLPEGTLAATIKYGNRAVIVGNASGPGFEERVARFAEQYLPDVEPERAYGLALTYVLAHELSHAYQGFGADDHTIIERDNEAVLHNYFAERAAASGGRESSAGRDYLRLARIAGQRYADVERNYGQRGGINYN